MTGPLRARLGAGLMPGAVALLVAGCASGTVYLSAAREGVLEVPPDRTQVALLNCEDFGEESIVVVSLDGVQLSEMSPPQNHSWCDPKHVLVLEPGRRQIRVRGPHVMEDRAVQRGVADVTFTAEAGRAYTLEVSVTVLSIAVGAGAGRANDALFKFVIKEAGTDQDVGASVSWVSG